MKSELTAVAVCRTALFLLLAAAICGTLFWAPVVGWSIVAGGALSLAVLWLSIRGVERVAGEVAAAECTDEKQRNALAARKKRGFQFAFLLRYTVTGVVLFVLIRWRLVNIFGLVLGLSTVFATAAVLAGAAVVHDLVQKNQRRKD